MRQISTVVLPKIFLCPDSDYPFYWWHLSAIILPKLSHKIIFTFITSVLLFEPTVTPTVMMCIDLSVIFVLSLLYKLEKNLIFLIKCSLGRYVLTYNEVVSSVTV